MLFTSVLLHDNIICT